MQRRHRGLSDLAVGRAALAVLVVGAIFGSACRDGPDETGRPDRGLTWEPCVEASLSDGECASLAVPLTTRSGGPTLDVALFRLPASGEPVGVLLVNPGGPGASGIDFVAERGRAAFPASLDVIGFDPRGTGRSAPLDCMSDTDLDAFLGTSVTPTDPADIRRRLARAEAVAQRCLMEPVAAAMGTVDVARDMDRIREALGVEEIDFLGLSYGARLGWTYAALFPTRVHAMVLDAPEDPTAGAAERLRRQAAVTQTAIDHFAATCTSAPSRSCPDDPIATMANILRTTERRSIATTGQHPPLSGIYAVNAMLSALSDRRTWPDLATALRTAANGDGTALLELSGFWAERDHGNLGALLSAQAIIECADHAERLTVRDLEDLTREVASVAPTLAGSFPGTTPRCHGYPEALEPVPDPPSDPRPRVLVVAATDDSITPIGGARHLVDALGNATLLTRTGPGHTSFGLDSCVDQHIRDFLEAADRPISSRTCA